MSEDCEWCELGRTPCFLHDPDSGKLRNVSGTAERERYLRWRERIVARLEVFEIEFPLGGSYVGHFLKYSRRY